MNRKLIGLAVLAVVVLALAFLGPSKCTSLLTAKKEAEVAKGQAGAAIDSGAVAMNTVSAVEKQAGETRATVKEGVNEIRSAPRGNSNAAALRAACRLRSYKDLNLERCAAVSAADPGEPARRDAPR